SVQTHLLPLHDALPILKNSLTLRNPPDPGLQGVRVVFRNDHFPAGPTDGTVAADPLVPQGGKTSIVHANLTAGLTYFYSLFAHRSEEHTSELQSRGHLV